VAGSGGPEVVWHHVPCVALKPTSNGNVNGLDRGLAQVCLKFVCLFGVSAMSGVAVISQPMVW